MLACENYFPPFRIPTQGSLRLYFVRIFYLAYIIVFPTIAAPRVPLINGGYHLMGKGPTYPKGMGCGNLNPA